MEGTTCELCSEDLDYCACSRCIICGTLYGEDEALIALSEESYCEECHKEENGDELFIPLSSI